MKRLIFALSILASTLVLASGTTANLSWTNPTTYTDGSPLPATDIKGYTITWTGGPAGSQTLTAGAVTSATVPIPCGTVSFTVTLNTTATALYPNSSSSPAGPVSYATGVTCRPNAVTGLTAQ